MIRPRLLLAAALGAATLAQPALAGRTAIVSEADLATVWTPRAGVAKVVPGMPAGGDRSQDICVAIGYQINTEGETSNFTQLKTWGSGAGAVEPTEAQVRSYVQASAASVSMWKFTAAGRARAVYTAASFVFPAAQSPGEPAAIAAHCRIDDLQDFVNAMQSKEQRRGNILKSRMESQGRDQASSGFWKP